MKSIDARGLLCPFKLTRANSDRYKNCEAEKCMAWIKSSGSDDDGDCGMIVKDRKG